MLKWCQELRVHNRLRAVHPVRTSNELIPQAKRALFLKQEIHLSQAPTANNHLGRV